MNAVMDTEETGWKNWMNGERAKKLPRTSRNELDQSLR
jgi:hypothetical protein